MRRARGRLHPNDEQLHARRLERHELHVQGELALGRASVTYTWVGGLLMDQQDATGLLYRRNRYYDPMSGRFTQEDPIGLAGGLNVYGFAGGDPVNFADPFGLCPPRTNDELCDIATGVTQQTAAMKTVTDALISLTPIGDAQQSVDR